MSRFRWNPRFMGGGSPFRELEKMRDYMEDIYSTLAGGVSQLRKNYSGVFPLVNLAEDGDNLYLNVELPGVAQDKLEVSVKGDDLTLRGEIEVSKPGDDVNYHRKERQAGSFHRTLTLPVKVNIEAIEAKFKNGILTVILPKVAEAKAHQISIKND